MTAQEQHRFVNALRDFLGLEPLYERERLAKPVPPDAFAALLNDGNRRVGPERMPVRTW